MRSCVILFVVGVGACADRSLTSGPQGATQAGDPATPATVAPVCCGGSAPDAGARLLWYWSGENGPGAVEILGDGTARGWRGTPFYMSRAPDLSEQLPMADVAELFAILDAVPYEQIPHDAMPASCAMHGEVRTCSTCVERLVLYSYQSEVSPELDAVWEWFDALASPISDFNPGRSCNS
jgi:hypothetical protein